MLWLDLEYAGLNGYVCTVKYQDGRVKMSADCLSDSGSAVDVAQGGIMSERLETVSFCRLFRP